MMFGVRRVPRFRRFPALSERINEVIDQVDAARPIQSVGTKMAMTALGVVRQAKPVEESESGDEPVWGA